MAMTYLCLIKPHTMNIYCRPDDAYAMHEAIDRLRRAKVPMGIETKEQSIPFSMARYLCLNDGRLTQRDCPQSFSTEFSVDRFLDLLDPPPFTYSITYPAGPLTVTIQSTDAKLFRAACADLQSRASSIIEALTSLPDPDLAKE
jgi:hypothetical protein